jgi:DamX protein
MSIHRNSPEFVTNRKNHLQVQRLLNSSLFPWQEQDQVLDTIHRLADNADEIMLMLGSTGAGKTTFSYRIQHEFPDHWFFCRISAYPLLQIYQLIQDIAQQLNLELDLTTAIDSETKNIIPSNTTSEAGDILITPRPPAWLDDAYLAEKLSQHCINLRLQGRLPVILIDDAEQMPAITLAHLLNLHEYTIDELYPFALILLAQPTLNATLKANDGYIAGSSKFYHLDTPIITAEQIQAYTRHFLRMSGIRRNPRWKAERFNIIRQQAQGLPGQINQLIKIALYDDAKQPRASTFQGLMLFCIGMIGMSVLSIGLLQLNFTKQIIATWLNQPQPQIASNGWVSQPLPLPSPLPLPLTLSVEPLRSSPPSNIDSESSNLEILPTTNKSTDTNSALLHRNNDWLLQQPATNYTLQVNNAGSIEEAKRYIDRHNLTEQAFYIEETKAGKSIYYVLYGVYQTRIEANAAVSKLPPSLRKKKPFPVNFKKLQSLIQPNH